MGTRRQYDRAFKERAVKLSYEQDNIKILASELGIKNVFTSGVGSLPSMAKLVFRFTSLRDAVNTIDLNFFTS